MDNLPIGILFPSLYLKNPSNSWVFCDGKEYSGNDYQDLWELLRTSILDNCSYSEFNTDVSTYGSCNRFAINLENKTFKVPLIAEGTFIEQDVLGTAYLPGLPNIRGCSGISPLRAPFKLRGAFGVSKTKLSTLSPDSNSKNLEIDFDASRSEPIYGKSKTVQPKAVSVSFLIYLGKHVVIGDNPQKIAPKVYKL